MAVHPVHIGIQMNDFKLKEQFSPYDSYKHILAFQDAEHSIYDAAMMYPGYPMAYYVSHLCLHFLFR